MKLSTLKKKKDNLLILIDTKKAKVKRLQEEIEMHRKSIVKTDEQIRNLKWHRQNCPDCKFGTPESLNKILDDIAAEHG